MSNKNKSAHNSGRSDTYHHGELRAALIKATDEILSEVGVEGFSLREAARRAGVSPGAPAHHFGNASGLLTEVAVHAYRELKSYLDRVEKDCSSSARLRGLTTEYVRFAIDFPGRFRLMFRKDLIDRKNEVYKQASTMALLCFADCAASKQGISTTDMLSQANYGPIVAAWSTAHGIAHLALEDKLASILDPNDPVRDFYHRLLPSIVNAQWPD